MTDSTLQMMSGSRAFRVLWITVLVRLGIAWLLPTAATRIRHELNH